MAQPKKPIKRKRKKVNWLLWVLVALGAVFLAALIYATQTRDPAADQPSVAPAIDDIRCQSMEGATQHTHSHLAIFHNGEPVPVPANIGIREGLCMYWLHTHDATGQIHVESPVKRSFTLGNFFDIWGEKLTATQVSRYTDGKPLKVYVDGKEYSGDVRSIELTAHRLVTLEVGPKFVPPATYTFPPGD